MSGGQAAGLAADVVRLVGGPENVEHLTRCWSRLRFVLTDPGLADVAGLEALETVVVVVHQGGQLQVALARGLVETFDAVAVLVPEQPGS